MEANEERPSIGAWDKDVLKAITDLGGCVSEERILKRLQGLGHRSLSQQSLLLPLQRLEVKGYLTSEWRETEKTGRLRYWIWVEISPEVFENPARIFLSND